MRAPGSWNAWYRVAGSIAAVALVTGAVELLKTYIPVLSLGVLYILAVLPVAIAFGPRTPCRSRSGRCSRSTSSSCRRSTR